MAGEVFKFSGARSTAYDQYLGPFLFEPYGKEMAGRVPLQGTTSVLEIASGTGRVTRHLRKRLPLHVKLVATDLSPDMLDIAKGKFAQGEDIKFVVADMLNLPFSENSFDVVVCQFGVMFPPDKQRAFNEAFRVLKSGGTFLFSTWEQTLRVPVFKTIYDDNVIPFFKGEDSARFKVPFSMYDTDQLVNLLTNAGFTQEKVERVELEGVADSAESLVQGFFKTHAVGQEVYDRDPRAFETISQNMERAIATRFSDKPVKCQLAAWFGKGVKG